MDPSGTLSVHLMIDSALLKHKYIRCENTNTSTNTLQVRIQTQTQINHKWEYKHKLKNYWNYNWWKQTICIFSTLQCIVYTPGLPSSPPCTVMTIASAVSTTSTLRKSTSRNWKGEEYDKLILHYFIKKQYNFPGETAQWWLAQMGQRWQSQEWATYNLIQNEPVYNINQKKKLTTKQSCVITRNGSRVCIVNWGRIFS